MKKILYIVLIVIAFLLAYLFIVPKLISESKANQISPHQNQKIVQRIANKLVNEQQSREPDEDFLLNVGTKLRQELAPLFNQQNTLHYNPNLTEVAELKQRIAEVETSLQNFITDRLLIKDVQNIQKLDGNQYMEFFNLVNKYIVLTQMLRDKNDRDASRFAEKNAPYQGWVQWAYFLTFPEPTGQPPHNIK